MVLKQERVSLLYCHSQAEAGFDNNQGHPHQALKRGGIAVCLCMHAALAEALGDGDFGIATPSEDIMLL